MGDMRSNRVITVQKVIDLVDEKKVYMKFAAPPEPGTWTFQVIVKSDSYVGSDVITEAKLVVEPPEAAPIVDIEDDISEPDEDTITGQMEALKGSGASSAKKKAPKAPKPKPKPKPKNSKDEDFQDSSDSEDEIDSDGPSPHDHDHDHDMSGDEDFIE